MTVEGILKLSEEDLRDLMSEHPFDRLGHDGQQFLMALYPVDNDIDMNMFVPVPIEVVQEFYIRLLCGHKHSFEFDV